MDWGDTSQVSEESNHNFCAFRCKQSEALSGIVFEALHRISDKIPDRVCYHTFEHTAEVISYAKLFAQADQRSDREIDLITYAATFHDIGFLLEPDNHEELGAELASALLLEQGSFSQEECQLVEEMILDTKVQRPDGWCFTQISNELSPYLCDADVSNFGRATFLHKAELVRREISAASAREYYLDLLEMLNAHNWHCNYAKQHLEQVKTYNRQQLLEILSKF